MTSTEELDDFTKGYLTTIFWTDRTEDDEEYDEDELAPETLAKIVEDCKDFQENAAQLLEEYCERIDGHQDFNFSRMASAGGDFALTRNGHGSGFWDRGLDELGEKLSEESRPFGNQSLYLGDDQKVYVG